MCADNSEWTLQVAVLCWFVHVYRECNNKVKEEAVNLEGG